MPVGEMVHEAWFLLPPAQEWYYRNKNPDYRVLPELHPACKGSDEIPNMEMIYPRHSARIYVPRELDGAPGKFILEAAHRDPATRIFWHMDDDFLGSTRYIHQLGTVPEKGNHKLILVDEKGNTLVHYFEIVDR
jgi:penicillin-binding protein 1C